MELLIFFKHLFKKINSLPFQYILLIQRHLWLFSETASLHSFHFFHNWSWMGVFSGYLPNRIAQFSNFAYCEITGLLEFRQSLFDFPFWSVEEKQTELNSLWNIANNLWNKYSDYLALFDCTPRHVFFKCHNKSARAWQIVAFFARHLKTFLFP